LRIAPQEHFDKETDARLIGVEAFLTGVGVPFLVGEDEDVFFVAVECVFESFTLISTAFTGSATTL